MPIIKHSIYIQAQIYTCFDLARNVDIHVATTTNTKEKAIAGVTSGLLKKDDTVTWEAIHFHLKLQLTAKIIEMEQPFRFTDVMVKGAFHSFTHTHEFKEHGIGTIMTDTFSYKSPLGILGKIADCLFLEQYMQNFIGNRAKELKHIAEKGLILKS